MGSSIRIEIDNTDAVIRASRDQIKKALEECGLTAERYAKEKCPVDTGNLRNSITHQMDGDNKVLIGSNTSYAAYVECGTGKYADGGRKTSWVYEDSKGNWHMTNGQKARPYLKPALANHTDEYAKIIRENLEG
jgi:HK97 gp10 family phage protein|nr:MAG TPA: putative tail component [Caudoviricetes sp.]